MKVVVEASSHRPGAIEAFASELRVYIYTFTNCLHLVGHNETVDFKIH